MAPCGQILKSWPKWRWSNRPHGEDPWQRFLSPSAFNVARKSNFISLSVSVISSSERASNSVAVAVAYGVFRECRSSCLRIPLSAFGRPQCPPRAQYLKAKEWKTIEPHVWNRIGSSQRAGLRSRPLVTTSAVASGFVSRDGTPNSTRKGHVEQLEEFYFENEFLFVDETWSSVGNDEISQLVKEKLSFLLRAGRIRRGSRVLVWGGSAAFVQELCAATSLDSLVVTHFSMSVLGTVKEMDDDLVCWLGNVEDLPDSYGPFDAVFLYSLMATAYSPADVLRVVASLCNPGARIVISHTQGKKDLAVCRDRNPHLILQNLPNVADLEKMVNSLPLNLVELQDEPSFYLATLEDNNSFLCVQGEPLYKDLAVEASRWAFPQWHDRGPSDVQHVLKLSSSRHFVSAWTLALLEDALIPVHLCLDAANIDPAELPTEFLGLSKGVYFGWARQDNADELNGAVYKMVMNIGNRPTFADGEGLTVVYYNFPVPVEDGSTFGWSLSLLSCESGSWSWIGPQGCHVII